MKLIGLLGNSGVGKDTLADHLVFRHNFVKVALADPLKRICKEVFDFTNKQLFGPSEERNKTDERYPMPVPQPGVVVLCDREAEEDSLPYATEDETCSSCGASLKTYLTPRIALQTLGSEWGRRCYEDVWIDYTLRVVRRLSEDGSVSYSQEKGLVLKPPFKRIEGVVISDVRHVNEVRGIKQAGGCIIHLNRLNVDKNIGGIEGHSSETETSLVPRDFVDFTLEVPEGITAYYEAADSLMKSINKFFDKKE